ncbi:MAG: hypothetical protein AAF193_08385, partial [Bacteroidota bacterium]
MVTEEDTIAIAYNKKLSLEDIEDLIPNDASEEDSTAIAERLIVKWLKDQALIQQAQLNLPSEQLEFEKELEEYRKSLIAYAYESQYVQQRLDTIISENEYQQYYEENIYIFKLKDYIVKVKYCILDIAVNKRKKFEKLF